MEIRFILIPIDERCKRRRHQQSCSPKQKQRQRQRESAFRRRRKKGGFDSLALSHSQFSSQCYSFLRALMMMMLFTQTCLMRLLIKHETQRLGENISFRVSNPNFEKLFFRLFFFSLFASKGKSVASCALFV